MKVFVHCILHCFALDCIRNVSACAPVFASATNCIALCHVVPCDSLLDYYDYYNLNIYRYSTTVYHTTLKFGRYMIQCDSFTLHYVNRLGGGHLAEKLRQVWPGAGSQMPGCWGWGGNRVQKSGRAGLWVGANRTLGSTQKYRDTYVEEYFCKTWHEVSSRLQGFRGSSSGLSTCSHS